jgi:hypothetical protein
LEFSGRGGAATKLTEWKKKEAREILAHEAFSELPAGVSSAIYLYNYFILITICEF